MSGAGLSGPREEPRRRCSSLEIIKMVEWSNLFCRTSSYYHRVDLHREEEVMIASDLAIRFRDLHVPWRRITGEITNGPPVRVLSGVHQIVVSIAKPSWKPGRAGAIVNANAALRDVRASMITGPLASG